MLVVLLSIFAISCGDKKEEAQPLEEAANIEATEEVADVEAEPVIEEAEEVTTEEVAEETPAPDEKKEETKPAPKAGGLVGQVVLLDKIVKGGSGTCTKAEAEAAKGKGGIVLFKSNGKLYFVLSESGAFASKRLINVCEKPEVTIKGRIKRNNGLNTIIMTSIE